MGYHWPCGIYSYSTSFLPRRPFLVVLREAFGTTPCSLATWMGEHSAKTCCPLMSTVCVPACGCLLHVWTALASDPLSPQVSRNGRMTLCVTLCPPCSQPLPFNGQLVHMACEGLYEKESTKVNMIYAVSLRPSAYKSCQLYVGYSLLPLGQI